MKEESLRLAALTALRDAIDTEVTNLRNGVTSSLLKAREELGVKSLEVTLPDGTVVASVSVTQPESKLGVVDEQAFVDWVRANAPTEVVETVRSSYQRALLGRLTEVDGRAVDEETGEFVAGVGRSAARPPYISLRYRPEGREAIGRAWAESTLPKGILPQLDRAD